ncbi:MAG: recombinase family protein [Oscillospiraceae bacterium]|nr:recombinase family protein [Oscillospiraceae bacterium]
MDYLKIVNPMDYRVALYIRLSKEDEKPGESESITNQRSILTRFAESQRLYIVDEYVDDGISGTTFNRPDFQRMLNDIETKKINMVITKDLSRLGRDYIQTGFYIEKYFPENRVRYISILDNVDTGIDSSSNDITPFKSILNDMYAKDISAKIKSVKHNKQDLGLFIGGKAPFGYKCSEETTNKIVIDEDARPVVERLFREAKAGKSCRAIAQDLILDGVPTPSQYAISKGHKVAKVSNLWSDPRVREILLNEVYIGNMVQGRTKKINYKSKKYIKLPKEQWKVVENTHEHIIDKETFYKVQDMILTRKQTRVKTHDYLLKGFVHCHECGKKVGCSPRELAQGKVYYFRCATYIAYARLGLCTSHNIRMDTVEKAVNNKVMSILAKFSDKDNLIKVTKQKIEEKKHSISFENEIENYKTKLNKISLEVDNIYNDKLNGILSEDDFIRIYERKKEEKENLQKKITEMTTHIDNSIVNETELAEKIAMKFVGLKQVNRELLSALVEKIEIDKKKNIYVYFKFKSLENV